MTDIRSPALTMAKTVKERIKTRKVAILAGDGVDAVYIPGGWHASDKTV